MVTFYSSGAGNWDAPSATETFSHTVNSEINRLLTVAISVEDTGVADYVNGVTWNGTPMTLATRARQYADWSTTGELYYILNPASGSHDMEITFGTNRDYAVAMSADFYNVEQTTPTALASANTWLEWYINTPITPIDSTNVVIAAGGFSGADYPFIVSGTSTPFGTADASGHNKALGLYHLDFSGHSVGFLSNIVNGRKAMATAAWNHSDKISCDKDLRIYYGNQTESSVICCFCSRWDVQNYSVVIETWLKKSDLQTLRDNITPQAVGELFTILGRPLYYDKTWSAKNTIRVAPVSDTQLSLMRDETIAYVKSITDSPIEGDQRWINVKIEGMISGSGDL